MQKRHAIPIVLALGLAAAAAFLAAGSTVHLGAAAAKPRASDAQLIARTRQLDHAEAALRREARQRPPALPRVPKLHRHPAPAATPVRAASPAPAAAPAAAVVYVRPAPIVHVVHRSGEHEAEHETEGGSSHEGGGGDD